MQSDGALYELAARGKKDIYFITNKISEGTYTHSSKYDYIEPHLTERRTQQSINAPAFGGTMEFDIERFGDTLLETTLLIDMPNWLPDLPIEEGGPALPPSAINRMYEIQAEDGYCYGWTQGIGYFLLDQIELYQDKILLYQTTGEALWLAQQTQSSLSQAYLRQRITGQHDGSSRQVAMNATPGQLRITIPWPGVDTGNGFPLLATTAHTYRLKLRLKKLDALIEAVPALVTVPPRLKPSLPWGKQFFYNDINFNTVIIDSIPIIPKSPSIVLETHQAYLRDEVRAEIMKPGYIWEVSFTRWHINKFGINENDMAPFDVSGGQVIVNRRLEGMHPASRIMIAIRSDEDLRAARYWKLTGSATSTNPEGRYWSSIKFLIAGREREVEAGPLVWEDLAGLKTERVAPVGQGAVVFSASGTDMSGPSGTINMSQADRPSLKIQLADAGSRRVEVLAVCETWGIYTINKGRGYVKFYN